MEEKKKEEKVVGPGDAIESEFVKRPVKVVVDGNDQGGVGRFEVKSIQIDLAHAFGKDARYKTHNARGLITLYPIDMEIQVDVLGGETLGELVKRLADDLLVNLEVVGENHESRAHERDEQMLAEYNLEDPDSGAQW